MMGVLLMLGVMPQFALVFVFQNSVVAVADNLADIVVDDWQVGPQIAAS